MGHLRSVGQINRKPKDHQEEAVYRKLDIETLKYAALNFLKKIDFLSDSCTF